MSKKTFNFILNTVNATSLNNGDKRFNIRLDNLQEKSYKMTPNFKGVSFLSGFPTAPDRLITISIDLGQANVFDNSLTQTNVSKVITVVSYQGSSFSNYYKDEPIFIEKVVSSNIVTVIIRNSLGAVPLVPIEYILILSFEEI